MNSNSLAPSHWAHTRWEHPTVSREGEGFRGSCHFLLIYGLLVDSRRGEGITSVYHGWAHKTLNVSSKLRATEKALVKLFIKQSKKTSKQEKKVGKDERNLVGVGWNRGVLRVTKMHYMYVLSYQTTKWLKKKAKMLDLGLHPALPSQTPHFSWIPGVHLRDWKAQS